MSTRFLRHLASSLAAAAFVAAFAVAAQSEPLPIENIQLRGDRFAGLHYKEMTEAQRAMLFNVVNSARAVTNTTGNGPFNTLLRTPEVGDLSQQLGNAIRFSSGLSGRLREMAMLMAGRAWTSTYEWYAHARYALDEGIDESVVAAIAEHRSPDLAAMPADAPPAAAAAAHALRVLEADALYRSPHGAVTPRAAIPNEDTERAIAALGASVERDAELPQAARDAARNAVERQWNRTPRDPALNTTASRFATELLETRFVSDATFAAALAELGERRLVNLMVLMGHSNIRCAQQALAGSACVL